MKQLQPEYNIHGLSPRGKYVYRASDRRLSKFAGELRPWCSFVFVYYFSLQDYATSNEFPAPQHLLNNVSRVRQAAIMTSLKEVKRQIVAVHGMKTANMYT
jgi:hypothetical protein